MNESDSTTGKSTDDETSPSTNTTTSTTDPFNREAVENWADRLNDAATGGGSAGGCLETAARAYTEREQDSKSLTKRGFLRGAAVAGIAATGVALPAGAAETDSATAGDTAVADGALLEYALADERVEEMHAALEAKGWTRSATNVDVADKSVVVPYDDADGGDGDSRHAMISWTASAPPQAYEIEPVAEQLTTHWYTDGERQVITATEAELAEQETHEDVSADPDPDGLLGFIMSLSPVGRASACDPHGPPESATGDSYDCCGTVNYQCLSRNARGAGIACIPCAGDPSRIACLGCAGVMINQGIISVQDCCSGHWY